MKGETALNSWIETIVKQMPHLSKPQACVLGLWSFGILMTQSCGLTSVAAFLASLLGKKEEAIRQQLREWYYAEKDKKGREGKGHQRQDIDTPSCFVPLLKWVLAWWPEGEKRLALAMDASALGQTFAVLAISVVYRGCAIPVAWVLLPANQPGAWKEHWIKLFHALHASVPSDWCVIVLADRGLYARWLYQHIVKLGWHPFLRINSGGQFRPEGSFEFRSLKTAAPHVGSAWCGRAVCFKSHPFTCTLLAHWDAGHTDPWLILTDLHPEHANACWYSLRFWIECGFKDTKRGGWRWQQTRITDPDRAARFWLAIAVATLWAVSVGGEADANLPASCLHELPANHIARRRATRRSRPRLLSCFRRGVLVILSALINGLPLPLGTFYPEPWPTTLKTYP
jgi:hypothetical protein